MGRRPGDHGGRVRRGVSAGLLVPGAEGLIVWLEAQVEGRGPEGRDGAEGLLRGLPPPLTRLHGLVHAVEPLVDASLALGPGFVALLLLQSCVSSGLKRGRQKKEGKR